MLGFVLPAAQVTWPPAGGVAVSTSYNVQCVVVGLSSPWTVRTPVAMVVDRFASKIVATPSTLAVIENAQSREFPRMCPQSVLSVAPPAEAKRS